MTRTISTKDSAQLLRAGLRNQYPGVKFSVTVGRGTAALWITVRYTDGPSNATVRAFARRYQGAQFNGMTDSYDRLDSRLVLFEGEQLPEEVTFSVDGIEEARDYSPAALSYAQDRLDANGYPEIRVLDDRGRPNDAYLPADAVAIDGRTYPQPHSPAALVRLFLSRITFTGNGAPIPD